jgi:uncharacterized protein YndB with AHSA1/START domain
MTQETTQATQTLQPIRQSVRVALDPQRAFDLFTNDMASWWPAEHHIGETPIKEIVIEPFPGGRWYTTHEGGEETSTGFVTAYDPPNGITLTWQIGADWAYHDDLVTTIELRFTATDDGRTLVELEHRDLDAFGEAAAQMRETFDAPDAWGSTLSEFARVAAERAGQD